MLVFSRMALLMAATFSDNGELGNYKVTASALNVRTGAGTNYSVLGSIKMDTVHYVYEIQDLGPGNAWAKISYNGQYGWVNMSHLVKTNSVVADSKPTDFGIYEVFNAPSGLNVRSGPGTSYSILGSLKNGQRFTVYESKDGFYRIIFNGSQGWVGSTYMKKI